MEEELNKGESQENKKEKKAKEKAEKEQSTAERTLQSYERTLLAWVRTGAHLMTFGFAIFKLLQQKVVESVGGHPVLDIISPKTIGLIMISSGFIGLLLALVRFVQVAKKYGQLRPKTYANPAMLQSYVILLLCAALIVGALAGR